MIIIPSIKIIISMTPRCGTNAIVNFMQKIQQHVKFIEIKHSLDWHHIPLSNFECFDFSEYTVFSTYRELDSWVISCWVEAREHYKISQTLDEFIKSGGIDTRNISKTDKRFKGDKGFDWFIHSPENMICSSKKNIHSCKNNIHVYYKNIQNHIFDKLTKIIGIDNINIDILNHVDNNFGITALNDEQMEIAKEKCCPLGIFPLTFKMKQVG